MRSKAEINALFAKAREDRAALLAELDALSPDGRVARLASEPALVRACVSRWRSMVALDGFAIVFDNKSKQEELNRQIARIDVAVTEAALRYYGYAGSRLLQTDEPFTEAASDMLDALFDLPPMVVTHEFDRALFAYR